MKQVYVVGGNGYSHPSDFVKKVNQNLKMLRESDNNAKVQNVQFTVHGDGQGSYGPTYLAFITATVDVDITPKVENDGITRKKKKKRKKK
jgi:hypothetical protein